MFERRGKERNEKQVVWFPYESQQQVLRQDSLGGLAGTKTKNRYVLLREDGFLEQKRGTDFLILSSGPSGLNE